MFRINICLDIEKKSILKVTYMVAMLQVSSKWDPVEACRPIIGEAPVFYPTFEVPLSYHYSFWWWSQVTLFNDSILFLLFLLGV